MSTTNEATGPRPISTATVPGLGNRLVNILLAILGLALMLAVATVPLKPQQQAVFAVGCMIVFFFANRVGGKQVTLFLVALSLAVSTRYIFWRLTETLTFGSPFSLFLGMGLLGAEIYAMTVLVLGYAQTAWPLGRKPMPLPEDPATWPTVDVYIPTYNEPMSIVRATVLAAMSIDWPPDKMRVWLLDDGKREEFREFAESIGCGYITRTNNQHAKAGNLNNAMTQTDGEFIAIFDCDHIPTRAFLQLTMGWLVGQPNIALVQTPHHFYSPDPFQRNLAAGTRVPPEGNMFYGLIQDGNDYWNAAFFCGSCAVLRRTALEEIGGIATETVTEDAHTALKLHRRGWDSAYLKIPLAAGLATERLALHLGQRIRWARGMIQILRIDNPLLGRGLTLGQRICYLQATGHFLFAVPRLVFLTSPLAFLLLGQNVISASPLAITAFAVPHIFHAVATNSRLQQNWRHSFWSEIYETVLALFLVRLTVVTLLSPRRGKFNVTAKGGLLENGFFDLRAVYPNLILVGLLFAGMGRGIVGLILAAPGTLVYQAMLLNTIWASISALVVLAALAVGRETRQTRSRARFNATLPVTIDFGGGQVTSGITRDLLQGGGSIIAARPANLAKATKIEIGFVLGGDPVTIPAHVLRWEGELLQARWEPASVAQEAGMVRAVFGRADTWTDWDAFPADRPLLSLVRVLVSIRGLFRPRDKELARLPVGGERPAGATVGDVAQAAADGAQAVADGGRVGALAGALALLLLLGSGHAAQAQLGGTSGTVVRPIAQPVTPFGAFAQAAPGSGLLPTQPVPPPPAPGAPTAQPGSGPGFGPGAGTAVVEAPAAVPVPSDGVLPAGARRVAYTLRQLGAQGPLALRGTSELQGVEFGVRADEVVTAAQLNVSGAMSPALIPEFSNVTVTLNEQYVATVPVNRDQAAYTMEMPVSPVFFQDNNRLNFRFTGRYTPECNDPLSGLLWATIYDSSTLTLTLQRLPPQRDLTRLPLPFFDQREKQVLSLPFVLPASVSDDGLRASAIVASWFGHQAAFRGAEFPVLNDPPSDGNAIMVVVGDEGRGVAGMPAINGPTVAVIANPNDPLSSLLVIAGRTGDEAATAATALTVGSRALGGDRASVQMPDLPARQPYDAPNWLPTNRPVKLGELVDAANLQSYGYVGLLHVPFRTAPDFYTWRNQPFPMDLKYRSPPGPIIDVAPSRLDVGINGIYLDTLSLGSNDRSQSWLSRLVDFGGSRPGSRIDVPAYDVFGANDLQFYFDARPLHRGECVAVPQDLRMSVDPDSTIDLSHAYRFAEMPNLAFFVNSGFPFTRMADLSETAVVVPDHPSSVEITAFLDMMGRFGDLTGYPVTRVVVVRPGNMESVADRDLLVMATLPRLGQGNELLRNSPLQFDGSRLSLTLPSTLDSIRRIFGDRYDADRTHAEATLSAGITPDTTVLVGGESPLHSSRSMVAVLAATPQNLEGVVRTFRDTKQAPLIQGDLSLLSGNRITSYRVLPPYTVGSLPFWLWPGWVLRDQPLGVALLIVAGAVLLGLALFFTMRRKAMVRLPPRMMKR